MPKVSFDEAVPETAQPQPEAALATREAALAKPLIANPEKGLVGEWTTDDVRLPRLNLVNKSGDLSNNFTPGLWVINKEHVISEISKENKERGVPITVIGVRAMKQYQENIPYDLRDSVVSRVFNSAAEVRSAGGILSRKKGEGLFSELAHIEFLIQKPEGLSEEASAQFFFTFGDKDYARVIYTASSTAFGAVAVPLASAVASSGHLNETGFTGGYWLLGSELKRDTKNSWWQPTFKSNGLVPAEIREEIAAII
jgi:hypothetical protein